jgi:predicted dehydrogenase
MVLTAALIGCGQIADAHLQELRRVVGTRVVAVCDRYLDVARQAATRYDVPCVFEDSEEMLAAVKPDVVHVTTPPQCHYAIVRQCLMAGAHVYVEKPFTVDVHEARELVDCAALRGRMICLGLDQLFDPAWQQCRSIVDNGELGDIVHVEAVQGYDFTGPFGSLLTTEPDHWVPRLPGGILQNALPHTVARVADFVRDEAPQVSAFSFSRAPGAPVATELRALVRGSHTSGAIVFSSAMRPVQRVARVLGTNASIEVDLEARTVTRCAAPALPGAFAKLELPLRGLLQTAHHLRTNIGRFWRSELQYFAGMRCLFDRFYAAIRTRSAPPIAHADALRVTALTDAILRECRASDRRAVRRAEPVAELERMPA